MSDVWVVPDWIDTDAVLADVLDVLGLTGADPDSARIEALIPAGAAMVEAFLDRGVDPLPPAPPMHPLVETGMTNVTIELYRRKDAPFGVLNAWSTDQLAMRISANPMRGVLNILLPLKVQFGIG